MLILTTETNNKTLHKGKNKYLPLHQREWCVRQQWNVKKLTSNKYEAHHCPPITSTCNPVGEILSSHSPTMISTSSSNNCAYNNYGNGTSFLHHFPISATLSIGALLSSQRDRKVENGCNASISLSHCTLTLKALTLQFSAPPTLLRSTRSDTGERIQSKQPMMVTTDTTANPRQATEVFVSKPKIT